MLQGPLGQGSQAVSGKTDSGPGHLKSQTQVIYPIHY